GRSASSWFPRPGVPVGAGGRRLDDDCLAGFKRGRVAALKFFHPAVLAPYCILADLAGLAAGKPEWAHPAMAGKDRAFHPLEETDGTAYAVARVPSPASARVFADVEVFEQHRIAEFQNLGIGEPRIGHVGVHRVGAGKARASRRAGADG